MNENGDLVWAMLAMLAIPSCLAGVWLWLIAHEQNSVTEHKHIV